MKLNFLNSFKSRIFVLVVTLIISVLAISMTIFYQALVEVENERFQNDLNNARNTVSIYLEERKRQFEISRRAIDNAIIEGQIFFENFETINSFVGDILRVAEADLVMFIDKEGNTITQVFKVFNNQNPDIFELVQGPETGEPFAQALDVNNVRNGSGRIYKVAERYYQFTLNPIESFNTIIGWVAYGYELNRSQVSKLHGVYANKNHVNFVLVNTNDENDCKIIASSKPDVDALVDSLPHVDCSTGRENFLQAEQDIFLGSLDNYQFEAIVYGARETLLSAISERLGILFTLIGIVIIASLLGVYIIASIISKPVKLLVQRARVIAGGKYDEPVVLHDSGELGQLANEFNLMQKAVLNREQAIRHQSSHDPLTDLPNRNKLFDLLQQWHDKDERQHGMLLIKVNHIKEINESLGHETGDKVISFVAERLRTLDEIELLSHLRADEFVILVKSHSKSAILKWIDLITKLMELPCSIKGMTLHLSVHIGIAVDFETRYTPGQFLRMADSALQMSRKMKLPYKMYDPSLDQEQTERLELMNELRTAIEDDQLLLHYQPKLNSTTNRVDKVEALVRWLHPHRGMVRPDKFISIAEDSGQINALTNWVLEAAAKQHMEWREQGMHIIIAVNISAENLKNDSFYESLLFLVKQYHLDISALSLEVTESAVVEDPETAIALLSRLKDQGFHLSIDDYGTGYSSLAQLKQLPVDELKIDMSFIKRLPDDEDDKIIVKSTIELAHNMGLTVVAEGVETTEGLEWLRTNNCDLMQGYYISKPLAGDDFAHWYKTSTYNTTPTN